MSCSSFKLAYNKEKGGFRMSVVQTKIHPNGLAELILNRPEALNALSFEMLQQFEHYLMEWEQNEQVQVIIVRSNLPKSFCAGGDIKSLYQAKENEQAQQAAASFFELEFKVDAHLARYQKPIIAYLNGIVMGGGVGLSYGARLRLVTETTRWAMPEMHIGYYPDVGAASFLHDAPGKIGYLLGLTGQTITGEEAWGLGLVDGMYLEKEATQLMEQFRQSNDVLSFFYEVEEFVKQQERPTTQFHQYQQLIDQWFSGDSMENIWQAVEQANHPLAREMMEAFKGFSPLSLKVTFELLKRGELLSFEQALKLDQTVAIRFLSEPDFFEGIRSVVIDKDRKPQYTYQSLDDVSQQMVETFFEKPIDA